MTLQVEKVSSLRAKTVSANYSTLQWNSISSSTTYKIQRKFSYQDDTQWETISALHYPFSIFYDENLKPNTNYDYAVIARQKGVEDSDRAVVSIKTFNTNSNNLITANNVQLYDTYISNRFVNSVVDNPANLKVRVTDKPLLMLMRSDYKFNANHTFSDIEPYTLNAKSNLAIYGRAPNGCGGFGCSIPALYSKYVFIFDRKQRIVRYSIDKGKTWSAQYILPDLTGNPNHESLTANHELGLFVMGYNSIMLIREDVDVHWSDTEYRLSDEAFTFSTVVESKQVNAQLKFEHFVDLPPGVFSGTLDAIAASREYLYVAVRNRIYRCNIETKQWDTLFATAKAFNDEPDNNDRIKNMVVYHSILFVYVCDSTRDDASTNSGVYVVDIGRVTSMNNGTYRIFGNLSAISPMFSSLTRDDKQLLLGLNPGPYSIVEHSNGASYRFDRLIQDVDQLQSATNSRPFREILSIEFIMDETDLRNSQVIFDMHKEQWQYEEQYIYTGLPDEAIAQENYSAARIRINDTNLISVITAKQNYAQRVALSDTYLRETTTIRIAPSTNTFYSFPGSVSSAVLCIYRNGNYHPIAYNSLPISYRNSISFSWLQPDIVVKANLQKYAAAPPSVDDSTGMPSLTPFSETFVPEHYSYREPKFVDFVREYLKYISTGGFSNYGQLKYLRHMHDANEKQIYIDMFETDLTRRNIFISAEKRKEINKFMYNRARDLYSIKGTTDSYKFLFRLLYNEHVEVKVENSYEFLIGADAYITHVNGNPTEGYTTQQTSELVSILNGQKIRQSDVRDDLGITSDIVSDVPTYGEIVSANIKPIDDTGYPKFLLTLVNLHGALELGKTYTITVNDDTQLMVKFASDPVVIPRSDRASSNRQHFILRLESALPMSRYRSDVINFVHPVGFDFIGAYLVSTFVYTGMPDYHIETIIEWLDTIRWDNGIPTHKNKFFADLDAQGKYQYSPNLYMLPNGNVSRLLKVVGPHVDEPIDPLDIDAQYYNDNLIDAYNQGLGIVYGLDIDARRTRSSPLFDTSVTRFITMINNPDADNAYVHDPNNIAGFESTQYIGDGNYIVSLDRTEHKHPRLKDNLQNPLDENATQRKHVHR